MGIRFQSLGFTGMEVQECQRIIGQAIDHIFDGQRSFKIAIAFVREEVIDACVNDLISHGYNVVATTVSDQLEVTLSDGTGKENAIDSQTLAQDHAQSKRKKLVSRAAKKLVAKEVLRSTNRQFPMRAG